MKENQKLYNSLDDRAIWNRIANSDGEALSYIYQKYYNNLYYFGIKSSRDASLTEDTIQDLFIKLWDKRKAIKIKLTIKSYLMTTYRRMLIDKLVAQKKQITKSGEFPEGHEPSLSVQDLIINEELSKEQSAQIERALSQLTKKQKEVIYLRFYQEMSYDEIAETLNIRNQSVRNCMYEAMKLMKKGWLHILLIVFGVG